MNVRVMELLLFYMHFRINREMRFTEFNISEETPA